MQWFSVTGHLSEKRVVMKKLITIVLLSVLAAPVLAQDYDYEPEERWTVKANAAYLPTVPILIDLFGGIFAGIAIGLNKDSNETLDFTTPPYISVEGLYSFNEDWSAGLSVGYCGTIFKTVDKDTREVHNRSTITLIPINVEGRLNYMNRPKCKLYGSLEAGIFLNLGNGSGSPVVPDVQLNPIGVEFGRRFFGMVELGIGMNYTGVRGGIGFRF